MNETSLRKISKYELCAHHAPWFMGCTRYRILECLVEGGPGGWEPGCHDGKCRLWPGTDTYNQAICYGGTELVLDWTYATRLDYLRAVLDAEQISYGELAELESLADQIEPGDVQLAEAAGIDEQEFAKRS